MLLLTLFGGLALLLYGMQLCGEGLQRAAGGASPAARREKVALAGSVQPGQAGPGLDSQQATTMA